MKLADFDKSTTLGRPSSVLRLSLAAALTVPLAIFAGCTQSTAPTVAAAPPLQTTIVESQTEKIDLRGVSFDRHGSLRPDSKPVLDAAADLLKTQTDAKVYVDAYCDPIGGPVVNQKVSDARAAAVKDYFVKRGVPADRLVARGFGATDFIASNSSGEGRKENRRIELVLVRG
jgi:outer membrane protein OmpA-like peptidoglycan-associated protein